LFTLFLKVEFPVLSLVLAIQTRGRHEAGAVNWVKTYRVKYSIDCVNFHMVTDMTNVIVVSKLHGIRFEHTISFTNCVRLKSMLFKNAALLNTQTQIAHAK